MSEFKGSVFVNIREYYEKDGKTLPGRKGIYKSLLTLSESVDIYQSETLLCLAEPQGLESSAQVCYLQ